MEIVGLAKLLVRQASGQASGQLSGQDKVHLHRNERDDAIQMFA